MTLKPVWDVSTINTRQRIISDNDYSGDPDGLLQLAQHLLSPSVTVTHVIGSHLKGFDGFNPGTETADDAAKIARHVAALCDRTDVPVIAGSNTGLVNRTTPIDNAASRAIIDEAMRTDTELPLYVVCGAGLTAIASAWLLEPKIGKRLTLVWIGGHEHDSLASPPPGGTDMEYNLGIDPIAGQVVFNDSDINIWHVPRDMYRTVIASRAEMHQRLLPSGELGRYLYSELGRVSEMAVKAGLSFGEVYILGDSPLVLLTVLQSSFEPDAASSESVILPCPNILDSGLYELNPNGRPIRVFTRLDNRALLEDLYAKIAMHAAGAK